MTGPHHINDLSQNMIPANSVHPELNFDTKVLSYIKNDRPQCSMAELLDEMKKLSPDKVVSLHELNKALLYSNTELRNTEEFKDYTDDFLDRATCQLGSLNMIYSTMLYHFLNTSED